MSQPKTHRLVKAPKISSRFLADYMSASEVRRRSIIRNCKYQTIARVLQHNEAKLSIAKYIGSVNRDVSELTKKIEELRQRLSDSDYERSLYDTNADYIERFLTKIKKFNFPDGDYKTIGQNSVIKLGGVMVSPDIHAKVSRVTKTNKVRIGVGSLRYSKGNSLLEETGLYQSAFLFGYLNNALSEGEEAEQKLCFTTDAWAGKVYLAPSDSVRRFNNMEAACQSIAERWDNIEPPEKCVL